MARTLLIPLVFFYMWVRYNGSCQEQAVITPDSGLSSKNHINKHDLDMRENSKQFRQRPQVFTNPLFTTCRACDESYLDSLAPGDMAELCNIFCSGFFMGNSRQPAEKPIVCHTHCKLSEGDRRYTYVRSFYDYDWEFDSVNCTTHCNSNGRQVLITE